MNHPFGKDFDQLLATPLPEREYFRAICQYVEFNHEEFWDTYTELLLDTSDPNNTRVERLSFYSSYECYLAECVPYDSGQSTLFICTAHVFSCIEILLKTINSIGVFKITDGVPELHLLREPMPSSKRKFTEEEVIAAFKELMAELHGKAS